MCTGRLRPKGSSEDTSLFAATCAGQFNFGTKCLHLLCAGKGKACKGWEAEDGHGMDNVTCHVKVI